jgi:hypothetical protein
MESVHPAESVRDDGFADECRRQIKRLRNQAADLRKRADLAEHTMRVWEHRLELLNDGDVCG